jgi:hypothetical protein
MDEDEQAQIEEILGALFARIDQLPADGEREVYGVWLLRMAQELLGPVYWPITLRTTMRMDPPIGLGLREPSNGRPHA